ncbi:MAG: hypothetical protein R3324_06030, partial [Halobacteriales archaeon]|nr:hypothetical protein [Halobacteriales archaeon]
ADEKTTPAESVDDRDQSTGPEAEPLQPPDRQDPIEPARVADDETSEPFWAAELIDAAEPSWRTDHEDTADPWDVDEPDGDTTTRLERSGAGHGSRWRGTGT